MVRNCCVPLCDSKQSKSKSEISFHELPCDIIQRDKWLEKISRGEENNPSRPWKPTNDRAVVCSLHFKPEDFISRQRRTLCKGVVPTIFNGYPVYKITEKTNTRKPPAKRASASSSRKRELSPMKEYSFDNKENIEDFPSPRKNSKNVYEVNENTGKHAKKIVYKNVASNALNTKWRCNQKRYCEQIRRKNSVIAMLRKKLKDLQNKETVQQVKSLQNIKSDADLGNYKALMLLEQINMYGKKLPRWSEFFLRMSVLWRTKSPSSYGFVRKTLINLPSRATLQRYLGPSKLELGFSTLIKDRLGNEITKLNENEIYTSLIFDEMSISPEVRYVKQVDKIIGRADLGKEVSPTFSPIANRLLCFVLKGLSTNYRIPVSYHLTKNLQGEELAKVIRKVIEEVENIGFKVTRLVCDCSSVFVKALTIICGQSLQPKIVHPFCSNRPLFIGFDACHILKNLRSQLMDEKRKLVNTNVISGNCIRALYKKQQKLVVKPVRFLTRKVVFPTSFEKMHVGRAVKIFSSELIAALKVMKNTKVKGFCSKDLDKTIEFMEIVKKWFDIHNVSNRTYYIRSRNENKEHFWLLNDSRLDWLENEFLLFFEKWKDAATKREAIKQKALQKSVKKKSKKAKSAKWPSEFLTKETYTALRITTLSTCECIKYLLSSGFLFVYTRKFTSDNVESLFAAIRSSQGSNDQAKAVGVLYSLDKILKTGIMSASKNSNVQQDDSLTKVGSQPLTLATPPKNTIVLTNEELKIAKSLSRPSSLKSATCETAGFAMVAGFLLRLLKDKHCCPESYKNLIESTNSHHATNMLISFQDRGGLMYPLPSFSGLVKSIFDLLNVRRSEHHNTENVVSTWVSIILPFLEDSQFKCGCGEHSHIGKTKDLIVTHCVKLFLHNASAMYNDALDNTPKFEMKTLSKKIKKL